MRSRCRLVLVRHGEAAMPDAQGRILNYSDAPLTERGRAQARGVAAALAGVRVGAVIASDLHRARETAAIIAGDRGAPVLADPRLREVDLGDYDGWSFARVAAEGDRRFLSWPGVAFGGRLARLGYHVPAHLPFPGGESAQTMHRRLAPAIAELAAAHPGETVVAVSHGWAIQAVICQVVGCDIAHYWRFTYANSVLTVLDVGAGGTGVLLVHNGNLELERHTQGRLAPRRDGEPLSDDRSGTCRVVLLCPGNGAGVAGELRGVEVAAVAAAPDAECAELAAAVEAACGTTPVVDARLDGGDGGPAALAGRAAAALGSAVVIVAGTRSAARLGAHITGIAAGGAARMPGLPGGLALAEVEGDGRGVLHIWNGRIAPEHVPPG